MPARVLVGICSWTDPTLTESGYFYPPRANTPQKRLKFYSEHYPIVEVDSSYYGLPSERNSALWVERTPEEFRFDVKAFSLLTHHPTLVRALPRDLRSALPLELRLRQNVYLKWVPRELTEIVWERFERALRPLQKSGKLGVVLFQFPPWFTPNVPNCRYIEKVKSRLLQYRVAIEFRNHLWFNERNRKATLRFLRRLNLPFVCVDEPVNLYNSVPRIASVTASTALVRFHGRNQGSWDKRGIESVERFNYFYSTRELREWVEPVGHLASDADEVHILFNNCFEDKAIRNADEFIDLLTPLVLRNRAKVVAPGRVAAPANQLVLL
jgi:uncharacterized protein YecE (DUF72 family)